MDFRDTNRLVYDSELVEQEASVWGLSTNVAPYASKGGRCSCSTVVILSLYSRTRTEHRGGGQREENVQYVIAIAQWAACVNETHTHTHAHAHEL